MNAKTLCLVSDRACPSLIRAARSGAPSGLLDGTTGASETRCLDRPIAINAGARRASARTVPSAQAAVDRAVNKPTDREAGGDVAWIVGEQHDAGGRETY